MENLIQILTIGVPEVTLAILFGAVVFKSNIFTDESNRIPKIILKIVSSVMLTLTIITISQVYIPDNLVIKTCISILSYNLSFKIIFRLNHRQSILAAMLVMFSLMVLEVTTYPVINFLMNKLAHKNLIILFLPMRVLQVMLIYAFLKVKFNLSEKVLLSKDWKDLSFQNKITLCILIFMVFADIMFNANYTTILFKLQSKNIEPQFINFNLLLYLVQTILFMGIVLVSFARTIDFEKYKEIVSKKPLDLFEEILNKSTQEEIYQYSRLVIRALHINSIVELERFMDYLKDCLEKFDYRIDEEIVLVEQDYTNMINFIEFIATLPLVANKLIYSDISKSSGDISCSLEIKNLNEIEMRKLQKELNQSNHYNSLKNELLSQKLILNVSYQENDVTFIIKSPIQKYFSEVSLYEKGE